MSDASVEDMRALIDICAWPSEAFWRAYELEVLRAHALEPPVLELGTGNGGFTALLGARIELGLDLNPRAIRRAGARAGVYADLRTIDLRDLPADVPPFRTVFANSVLEHVVALREVLLKTHDVLEPGGALVTTVPIAEMNEHLLWRSPRYVARRQRSLQHRNLWSLDAWRAELALAGFPTVTAVPYLGRRACRAWDALDAPGAIGVARFRLASVLRRSATAALPQSVKRPLKHRLARGLVDLRSRLDAPGEAMSAALLIAERD